MLNAALHKNLLLQILKDLYSDQTIGPFLVFKGGTAAYLFYGLDRFSVDLDFDLLDETQAEAIFDKIEKICQKYGMVKEARKKRFGFLFVVAYDQKIKNAKNIKIEINLQNFGSKYEVKSFMGISMLVMIKEDMFANKLVAMSERPGKTNRDIYDVYFFSKNLWPVNREIVTKRSGLPYKKFLRQTADNLEKINDKKILDGLGELVSEKQKAWIRAKLKDEVLFALKLLIEYDEN